MIGVEENKNEISDQQKNKNSNINKNKDHEISDELNKKVTFEPPLYIQRYDFVADLLNKYECKTYMDIGCADSKLIRYIKNTNETLNLIVGLDLDTEILEMSKEKITGILFDFIHPRQQPLDLCLLQGDISQPDPYFIEKLNHQNSDLDFVSLVEIIEHLYPETLKNCINTVFGMLKPRLCLITTPNSDFNVVFDEEWHQKEQKFRHWDHKFEWSRHEFQSWCQNQILSQYEDYELVFYSGLGQPPKEFEARNIGECTQMALFQRKSEYLDKKSCLSEFKEYIKEKKRINIKNREMSRGSPLKLDPYLNSSNLNDYKQIIYVSYPFETYDFETLDQRNKLLVDEIQYFISFLTRGVKNFNDCELEIAMNNNIDQYDETSYLVSIDKLCEFNTIIKFKLKRHEIIEILKQSNKYELTKCENYVIYRKNQQDNESSISDHDYIECNDLYSENKETTDENNNSSSGGDTTDASKFKFEYEEQENWDNKNEQVIVYTPEEQFEDSYQEEKSNNNLSVNSLNSSGYLSNTSSSNDSYIIIDGNSIISLNLFQSNYYANRSRNLFLKLKSKRRKVIRELRKKSFTDLKLEKLEFGMDSLELN
jgi:hypothetical protein